ncbi:MAG: hypothetical protein M0Z49_16005, partial [Chloroflexi bacterium]|nr:hypothetical protein [Chloroflexota bacterium]
VRISFRNNTVSGTPRALFITSDSYGRKSSDIVATGNRFVLPTAATDRKAVTTYAVTRATITGNTASGWGADNFHRDYLGLSTGLVISGNTIIP